jgi:hypothetical protein
MNQDTFYKGQKLLEKIHALKAFVGSADMKEAFSHIVICNKENTKNQSIPDFCAKIIVQKSIELSNEEIARLQSEFDAL